MAHNQEAACSNHAPATMNGTAKQASAQPIEPMHKITFHILDPISGVPMKIEQEWRGAPEYLAGNFHERGVMVETPNGDATWYSPLTIVRMTFKEIVEKPRKKQTLFSKNPPPDSDLKSGKDVDPFNDIYLPIRLGGIPF